jgi:fluoroquinolone transport system permease protein
MRDASPLIALFRKDARVIYRDGFMLLMLVYPLVIALGLRFGVPFVPIPDFDVYLAPVVVLFGPMFVGTVLGFTLIEERENRTWLLLRVLPLPERVLFGYFFCVSAGLSFGIALVSAVLYGRPVAEIGTFVAMAAVCSLTAPLVMLLMASLASNKIEGMAVSKSLGLLTFSPALSFVISPAWQLTLSWNPFYWIYLGLLEAVVGPERVGELAIHWPDYPLAVVVVLPALVCFGASLLLLRRYRAQVG